MSAAVAKFARADKADRAGQASPRWLIYYYLVQFVCQLALLSDRLSGVRFLFRIVAYSVSLVALALTAGRKASVRLPGTRLSVVVLAILALETFSPETTTPLAGVATVAMYLSILAPLFWIPRLDLNIIWFERAVTLIWSFQSISALIGVLQVYYPNEFQPAISTLLNEDYVASLHITLANGDRILRPCGLTDTPGGAAAAGTYAILLALGLWTTRPKFWFRLALAASMGIGMFLLYICQVRSLVVMVSIALAAMAFLYALRGRVRNLTGIGIVLAGIGLIAFGAAVSVGGDQMVQRLATLTQGNPTDVYYENRGIFLEHTLFDLLPEYPLGAGLGKWGVIANYFGGTLLPGKFIYAEIQWTAWLLDGGIPLIGVYVLMVVVTMWSIWSFAARRQPHGAATDFSGWATVLLAYNIGTFALTFNFPVFTSSFGLDFWILNSSFMTAVLRQDLTKTDDSP